MRHMPEKHQTGTEFLCHRCGTIAPTTETEGDPFYIVRIEAFADPAPPQIDASSGRELESEIDRLIESMQGLSERELMDQVYRKLTITLCGKCYATWIENPTG